jgi:hypothetical protein
MTTAPGQRLVGQGLRRAAAAVLLATLAGCGAGQSPSAHPPRETPTVVATAITPAGVSLSPDHLATGPVKLVITNMTDASQQLTVASDGAGSFRQETAPINPQDMAQLRARLLPGSYTVSVRAAGVKSASLAVAGRPPASP